MMNKTLQSSMGRACAEAIRTGNMGRTATGRMTIKEPWDSSRCRLGKIIHDGGERANELWDARHPPVLSRRNLQKLIKLGVM